MLRGDRADSRAVRWTSSRAHGVRRCQVRASRRWWAPARPAARSRGWRDSRHSTTTDWMGRAGAGAADSSTRARPARPAGPAPRRVAAAGRADATVTRPRGLHLRRAERAPAPRVADQRVDPLTPPARPPTARRSALRPLRVLAELELGRRGGGAAEPYLQVGQALPSVGTGPTSGRTSAAGAAGGGAVAGGAAHGVAPRSYYAPLGVGARRYRLDGGAPRPARGQAAGSCDETREP